MDRNDSLRRRVRFATAKAAAQEHRSRPSDQSRQSYERISTCHDRDSGPVILLDPGGSKFTALPQ